MPVLNRRSSEAGARSSPARPENDRLLPSCGNRNCKTGWLRVWRPRSGRFEGQWACSPECMRVLISHAVRREWNGQEPDAQEHRHRIPLGLLMLSHGWITHPQLRSALEAQKSAASSGEPARRIGRWLIQQGGVDESVLTRALSLQWNCPVLALDRFEAVRAAEVLPRLLAESFGALPIRSTVSGKIILAFEDRPDPCVSFAVERMTGCAVEAGLVRRSEFRAAHGALLQSRFPKARILEAASAELLTGALLKAVEAARPVEARMTRVHEYLWLRLWRSAGRSLGELDEPEDVLCSLLPR